MNSSWSETPERLDAPRASPRLSGFSATIAGIVAALGAVVLVGWLTGADILVRLRQDFAAMVPSTAFCFILVAGALLLQITGRPAGGKTLAARIVALVVAVIAIADIIVVLTGTAPGIDSIVWQQATIFQTDAMAFATAVNFLLTAICITLVGRTARHMRRIYQLTATLGLIFSFTAVVGYAFDAGALYDVFIFTAMAVHTSIGFVALFSAFLLAQPQEGWVGILTGNGSGSAIARRLFPAIVAGNFVLCFLALQASNAGFVSVNFRLSILAIAMIALSTAALLRIGKVENDAEKERNKLVEELRATVRDKDLLLREVNHRVKNNLQQINAMIAMGQRRHGNEVARQSLRSISERVHALGLVHQKLIQGPNTSEVALADFLTSIAADIESGYNLEERGIRIDVKAIQDTMTLDVSISIGLLVNELLTNAIKHAFPDNRTGTIGVSFDRDEHGDYELTIVDDGIGQSGEGQPGVGTRIIDNLVRQLRAEAKTETTGGTRWKIRIPKAINDEGRYV